MWVVSHQKEERGLVHGFIWPIVVSEFHHREIGYPVILMLICPEAKILLQPLIRQYQLSVSARVVCSRDVLLDA